MGIPLPPEAILTSALATGLVLRERYPRGTKVCSLGMDGLHEALFGDGYFVPAGADARVVVAGINLDLTYAMLREATLALRAGADFFGTNADRTFPAPDGLVPGAGSIIAALVAASDREPEIIGKPFPSLFEAGLRRLELAAHEVLMVGDRLDTDVLGAQRLGIPTAWLGSGVNSWAEAEAWEPRPTLLFDDLDALLTYLEESR
jgi:4-nitrophenyl phosphatase